MADTLFEFVAAKLQDLTDLDQLEARGTLRIALKEAGLDARSATAEQFAVMLEKTMPRELEARGVSDPEGLCAGVIGSVRGFAQSGGGTPAAESPEDVFRRLGGR